MTKTGLLEVTCGINLKKHSIVCYLNLLPRVPIYTIGLLNNQIVINWVYLIKWVGNIFSLKINNPPARTNWHIRVL